MSLKRPKVPATAAPAPANAVVPNLDDAQNQIDDGRRKRLASGGRNATFLATIASAAAPSAGPTKTLTGLQG